jgi:hypothetical protein
MLNKVCNPSLRLSAVTSGPLTVKRSNPHRFGFATSTWIRSATLGETPTWTSSGHGSLNGKFRATFRATWTGIDREIFLATFREIYREICRGIWSESAAILGTDPGRGPGIGSACCDDCGIAGGPVRPGRADICRKGAAHTWPSESAGRGHRRCGRRAHPLRLRHPS